ncbi:biliverdin-producing heme oxygenase [Pseudoalteromonas rubra]|uniref:Heme oxygenase n=1 Tax=Pseudoalteromonas rubra TaxID=43658 RepID=A0A0F4QPK6_9GAMM|nr:biliverdin-producing heme oxygenase [Pseudoalteromonas rubra]KJZ09200.1 hypothetical protein TW77_10810 [Pseudoalteromonas rubra]
MHLHEGLKRATKDDHRRLEALSVFHRYFDKSLSKEELGDILRVLFYVYQAWQRQFDEHFEALKLPSLWRVDLGVGILERCVVQQATRTTYIPPLPLFSVESYLGCAYVFQGSRLGNSVIHKTLSRNAQLTVKQTEYFKQMVFENFGLDWSGWMSAMEDYSCEYALDNAKICQAAKQCFITLLACFRARNAIYEPACLEVPECDVRLSFEPRMNN